ncbi:MAG TPA: ATP-binding protein [Candidatus Angelobacter sp.]|nr:ATP-binding protein [Candidatus Angelobacter sp.]
MLTAAHLAFLAQIARKINDEPDFVRGLESLLKGITKLFDASHAAIYRLHLDRSQYVLELGYLLEQDAFVCNLPGSNLDANDLLQQRAENRSALGNAILTRSIIATRSNLIERPPYMSEENVFTILVPISRGQSCLGVLRLDSLHVRNAEGITDEIEIVCALIVSLFEKQSSLSLLKAVQRPIDFRQSARWFLDDILLLIAEAARVPYIVIHEWNHEQALRCIGLYGPDGIEIEDFDFEPIEVFVSFFDSLNKAVTVVEPNIDAPHLGLMRERREFRDIKSFVVVPVRAGIEVFGTVFFGARLPYDYSSLEVAGFESIASSIGTAIANARNANVLRELSIADTRIGLAISGLEVAQAARHEVRGVVDDCIANLATFQSLLRQNRSAEIEAMIQRFEKNLLTINTGMDRIKNASREPDDKLELQSLVEIWQQARALVSARLEQEHIQTKITRVGRDIRLEILPDSLRHAFLHLLLNSIDAFKNTRHKGGRLITISIDPMSDAATDVKIRYADNATGIDPAQFHQSTDANASRDIRQIIFEKGVTTKPSGSGFGLYLVRMILDRHHGSIELANYRGGIVFDMKIPKDLRTKIERH